MRVFFAWRGSICPPAVKSRGRQAADRPAMAIRIALIGRQRRDPGLATRRSWKARAGALFFLGVFVQVARTVRSRAVNVALAVHGNPFLLARQFYQQLYRADAILDVGHANAGAGVAAGGGWPRAAPSATTAGVTGTSAFAGIEHATNRNDFPRSVFRLYARDIEVVVVVHPQSGRRTELIKSLDQRSVLLININ